MTAIVTTLKDEVLEIVTCNLCGSENRQILYQLRDWACDTPGLFSLVKCECGLVYLNPRPTEATIRNYYPSNYIPFYQPASLHSDIHQWLYYRKWRSRCHQVWAVRGRLAEDRILDIGCSSGLFLQALSYYAPTWKTHGVEVDPDMAALGQQSGLAVMTGDVAQAAYPDDYFDVITLWDVFEHLHDPKQNLVEIARILKPSGHLFISVPNLNSLDAWLFQQYWIGYDTPRHLYIYNAETLRRYLTSTGFNIEKIYSFYGRYTTFAFSLQSWLKQYVKGDTERWWLKQLLFFPLWRQVTLPYFWTLDQLGLGTTITVRARLAS